MTDLATVWDTAIAPTALAPAADIVYMGKTAVDLATSPGNDRNFWALATEYLRAAHEFAINPTAFTNHVEPTSPVALPAAGYYTIVFGSEDDRVTLRVSPHWDETAAARGDLVVGYLAGEDNAVDYCSFGFLSPHGLRVWKKYHGKLDRQVAAVGVLTGAESHADMALAYAMQSGRCARCHRLLTVPASLHRGYGPECAKKIDAA